MSISLTIPESQKLNALENTIARGWKAYLEVGEALLAIRNERLYRANHSTFEDYCQQRWGMKRAQAYRLMDASEVADNLSPIGDKPTNEAQYRELAALPREMQAPVWKSIVSNPPASGITAAFVRETVETYKEVQRGAPPALHSSDSNEWYTKAEYVNAAREVMGAIDLDPASCELANRTVKAAQFYTIDDNGLSQSWSGRVWLNPPYGRDGNDSNQALWSARLIKEFCDGDVSEAVLLVNSVTDCQWFQPLWDFPICFTDHRIRFYNSDGEGNSPTHGNAFVYFGSQADRFAEIFSQFGAIVKRVG